MVSTPMQRQPLVGSTTPWSRPLPGVAMSEDVVGRRLFPVADITAAEEINETYVGRVLWLTLLAPDIVDAILGARQPAEVALAARGGLGWTAQVWKLCK